MKRYFRQTADFPFHPFLIATYFFAHLYAANMAAGMTLQRAVQPYFRTLAIAGLAWLILGVLLKSLRRSAVLVSAGIFIFFSAGHVQGALEKRIPMPMALSRGLFLAAWGGLCAGVWTKRLDVRGWSPRLNLIAFLLFLMPFSQAVFYRAGHKPSPSYAARLEAPAPRALTPAQMQMVDVYYIILDGYADHDVLKEALQYDNSWFLEGLRKMGFYISEDSRCNYMSTIVSLASSLNMTYLDFIAEKVGPDSKDMGIPFEMVAGNVVARKFKELGYQYVITDSGVSPFDKSPQADKVYSFTGTDEFSSLLTEVTMLKGAGNKFIQEQQRQRLFFNFKAIETIPDIPGPTFAFLHVLAPHPPFVFDRDGNPAKAKSIELNTNAEGPEYQKLYLDQLIYTSKVTLEIVQKILSKSERTPIIIIQADHGLHPKMPWEPTETFVRQRSLILNAFLVPPAMREKIYPGITPVNTFRLLFKTVFGAPLELIEDRTYFSNNEQRPYTFKDVTPTLNKAKP